jgi:hypothetical protein
MIRGGAELLLHRKSRPAELLISGLILSLLTQQSCWPSESVFQTTGCQLADCTLASKIEERPELSPAGSKRMLWTVFAILLLLWLLGWGFHVAGSLIHLILVIALVVLVIELITGRRATV